METKTQDSKAIRQQIEELQRQSVITRAFEVGKQDDETYCLNAVALAIATARIRPASDVIGQERVLRFATALNRVKVSDQYRLVTTQKRFSWVYCRNVLNIMTQNAQSDKSIIEILIDAICA